MPAHSQCPLGSWVLGSLLVMWELQRLFCQEAERLHEYFIREAMCWPRNIWLDSPGSLCRKQDCKMQRRWVGALASAAEGSSLSVTMLAQATHSGSMDKDLPVSGCRYGQGCGGELSGSPRARLPLLTLPTQAHGQVRATRERRSLGLNLQRRPQTGAGLETEAA